MVKIKADPSVVWVRVMPKSEIVEKAAEGATSAAGAALPPLLPLSVVPEVLEEELPKKTTPEGQVKT